MFGDNWEGDHLLNMNRLTVIMCLYLPSLLACGFMPVAGTHVMHSNTLDDALRRDYDGKDLIAG